MQDTQSNAVKVDAEVTTAVMKREWTAEEIKTRSTHFRDVLRQIAFERDAAGRKHARYVGEIIAETTAILQEGFPLNCKGGYPWLRDWAYLSAHITNPALPKGFVRDLFQLIRRGGADASQRPMLKSLQSAEFIECALEFGYTLDERVDAILWSIVPWNEYQSSILWSMRPNLVVISPCTFLEPEHALAMPLLESIPTAETRHLMGQFYASFAEVPLMSLLSREDSIECLGLEPWDPKFTEFRKFVIDDCRGLILSGANIPSQAVNDLLGRAQRCDTAVAARLQVHMNKMTLTVQEVSKYAIPLEVSRIVSSYVMKAAAEWLFPSSPIAPALSTV